MAGYENNAADTWICSCGKANAGKFCVTCGSPRPTATMPSAEWVCNCGMVNTGKFCVACGAPQPAAKPADGMVVMPPRSSKQAVERERVAAEVAEVRTRTALEAASSAKAASNKDMLMKVAIGVAVLLLLIGAYFMFGKRKETPPTPELPKVETRAETKAETKTETEKPMDPAAKVEKLKAYGEAMKAANSQKRQDATSNEKIVFLVYDVQRRGNDLVVYGHFYNGKKNRTIIGVKSLELDIVLRDMDKELLNEKNIKYSQSFTGMNIEPLKDSQVIKITLPGKAPAVEFNNYMATAHDVHWEAISK